MKRLLLTPIILLAVSAAPRVVCGQADLPDALELLDKHRASLGEPAVLAGIKNLRCHGKLSWDGGGPETGFLTEVFAGLGKARSTTEFAAFGTFEYATNGEFVWEKSPLGIVIREGWDACQYIREFALTQHVDWREMYTKARCVGMAQIDGAQCYELHMFPKMLVTAPAAVVTKSPPPDVWYLDAGTYLLRRVLAKSVGVFEEPVVIRLDMDDWRVVDGVRYPHAVELELSDFPMMITYQSFEHNIEIPDGFFDPDEDVRLELARQQDPEYKTQEKAIRIETLETRHIASIRVTCRHEDMQKTLAVLLPEAMHHVLSVGGSMVGPPLVRYHTWGEPIDLEAAIPVTQPIEPKGRVKAETLPAGMAVVVWHLGPYGELPRTHKRLTAYIEAEGLELRGAAWEEYWTDPGMEPDPAKWRTKVVWPVKPK